MKHPLNREKKRIRYSAVSPKNALTKPVCALLILLFWFAVWEGAAVLVQREILLPGPFQVIRRLGELLTEVAFYSAVFSSLLRILAGYLFGMTAGCLFALFSFAVPGAHALLSPLFTAVRATPVSSFIVLALVWMGKKLVPSFTAFLMVLPIVYASVSRGLRSADRDLWEVTVVFDWNLRRRFRYLYLPSVIPSVVLSATTTLGLAWKAGVAAEVLCSLKNSIGGNIYFSKLYLESVDLLAWTAAVVALSLLLEILISGLSGKLQSVSMNVEENKHVSDRT